jgi:hypothetical protein
MNQIERKLIVVGQLPDGIDVLLDSGPVPSLPATVWPEPLAKQKLYRDDSELTDEFCDAVGCSERRNCGPDENGDCGCSGCERMDIWTHKHCHLVYGEQGNYEHIKQLLGEANEDSQ